LAAYVIVEIHIDDPVRYEDYKKMAAPTVEAFGGRYIVRGGRTVALEGEWPPARLVVLEFPDAARAKEWWSSELYAPAKALRQTIARTRMLLVEGV
jgi:uncharacterized protein (DUF1330 family)